MRIAITGGTGTIGREVAWALYERGHEVRVLARGGRTPIDLTDGSGLAEALDGVDAVVDATGGSKAVLVDGAARLLAAEAQAGVRHHVAISIVGVERHFALKREQERVVKAGPVPWTIVRTTQSHALVDSLLAKAARLGVTPSGALRVQPVDPRDIAHVLADAVEAEPALATSELAGPEILTLRELGRLWRRANGSQALPLWIPLRAGALTSPGAPRGRTTFAQWLREREPVSVAVAAPRRPARSAVPPR